MEIGCWVWTDWLGWAVYVGEGMIRYRAVRLEDEEEMWVLGGASKMDHPSPATPLSKKVAQLRGPYGKAGPL